MHIAHASPTDHPLVTSLSLQGQHKLVLHTYCTDKRSPSKWQMQQHVLSTCSLEQAQKWAHAINTYAAASSDRPRNLLVFVNPFSGKKSGGRRGW
jgi:ceramide kinase